MKSGAHLTQVVKHKKRFKKGGIECNSCKKIKTAEDYGVNKSRCQECMTKYYKKRYQKARPSLW